jgi:hypothetical protein
VVEGYPYTFYFNAGSNQRKRKKKFSVLVGPNGPIETTEDMLGVAVNFYKNPFGKEDRPDIFLDDGFWDHFAPFRVMSEVPIARAGSSG